MHLVTLMPEEMIPAFLITRDCVLLVQSESCGIKSRLRGAVETQRNAPFGCFWTRKNVEEGERVGALFPCGPERGWTGWNKAIGMRNRWEMHLVKEAVL